MVCCSDSAVYRHAAEKEPITVGRVAACHTLQRCSVLGTRNCGKEQGVAAKGNWWAVVAWEG
jgi:hypothetical protein